MNKRTTWVTILILAIFLILIFAVIWFKDVLGDDSRVFNEQLFISSVSSYFGMLSGNYLFKDGSFLVIDDTLGFSQEKERPGCYQGELSEDEYQELLEFVKAKNFFDLQMKQKRETGLICEGSSSLQIRIGDKSNSLTPPCVSEYTEETKEVIGVMDSIKDELRNKLLSSNKKVCQEGIFIEVIPSSSDNCDHLENHELSEIDPFLKRGVLNKGVRIYGGEAKPEKESYHREYYKVDGNCYLIILHFFNGYSFESYD